MNNLDDILDKVEEALDKLYEKGPIFDSFWR